VATLNEIAARTADVRAALIRRYRWFIHTSPERNIDSIRKTGLRPNRDVDPSKREGVVEAYGSDVGAILCLHPLGAMLYPSGANATAEPLPIGQDDPKRVTFAIEGRDLPSMLALDWSYEWERVRRRLAENPHLSPEDAALLVVNELGSIASLVPIAAEKIRVFCVGDPPANPLDWARLVAAGNESIVRHR
jgi:hypothetical protein